MKSRRITGGIATLAVMSSLLAGCLGAGGTVTGTLATLQGHWVDVNGETTLDFKGNRMTVTSPWEKETYRVKISGEGAEYIENDASKENYDTGFHGMSTITIASDGSLSAREMVLDAEGHHYRFVRQEDLDKELEIQIMDRDLPKIIESDEIVSFCLNFSNEDTFYDIPTDGSWYDGRYVFTVERTDEGEYEMSLHGSGSSYMIVSYDSPVSEKYVKGLADLVKEQKLAKYNGWWRTNREQFHDWSVNIEYASGEKILMEASGRAALECPFSIYSFLKYADLEAGYTEEMSE